MNLRDFLGIIWRRRWLVLGVVALGAVMVELVGQPSLKADTTYSGTANLAATDVAGDTSVLLYGYVATDTSRITELTALDMGPGVYGDDVDTLEMLEATVEVIVSPEIGTLSINVYEQPTEETATKALDRFGQHLIDYSLAREQEARDERLDALAAREQVLLSAIEAIESEAEQAAPAEGDEETEQEAPNSIRDAQLAANLAALNAVLSEKGTLEATTVEELTPLAFIGAPTVTADEAPTDLLGYRARLAVGLALALGLGLGLAFALHRVDTRVYDRRDVEGAYRLPVLATVAKLPRRVLRKNPIIIRTKPLASASRSFRVLRSAVARSFAVSQQVEADRDPKVVLVTSTTAGVGKTTTVANLAVAAVEAGNEVLIVNGDLQGREIQDMLGVGSPTGIVDAVHDGQAGRAVQVNGYVVPSEIDRISILAAGGNEETVNPGEMLAKARPLIAQTRDFFDLVLVDTPAMLAGNDVDELMPLADLVLLVARAGRSTIEDGEWALASTQRMEAPVAGVVLIGARSELKDRTDRGGLIDRIVRRKPPDRGSTGRSAAPDSGRPAAMRDGARPAGPPFAPMPVAGPGPARSTAGGGRAVPAVPPGPGSRTGGGAAAPAPSPPDQRPAAPPAPFDLPDPLANPTRSTESVGANNDAAIQDDSHLPDFARETIQVDPLEGLPPWPHRPEEVAGQNESGDLVGDRTNGKRP